MVTIQQHVAHWLRSLALALTVSIVCGGAGRASDAVPETCLDPGGAEAVIAKVEDWRNLALQDGRRVIPAGIADFGIVDSPSSALADQAENALAEEFSRLAGRPLRVRLLGSDPDRRGRLPALLWGNGRLLQQNLIAKGIAIAYPHDGDLPCPHLLLPAEAQARDARLGYWAQDNDWITGTRSADFAGRLNGYVIMQGRVISVGTRTDRTYLNFGGRWATDVTVEIPDRHRDAFGGAEALEALAGSRVRVRGFAVEEAGPMIELHHPWQIERLTNHPG